MDFPIYMDNNATTRCDPRVVEAMVPCLSTDYGNASSRNHEFGWRAEQAVESARESVAALIGAQAREIIFTSGATESDNLAIKGVVEACGDKRPHVITAAAEHKAVLDVCKLLRDRKRCDVTILDVDAHGQVHPEQVAGHVRPETVLVSIMAANNEIGTLNRVGEIAAAVKRVNPKTLFHSDATQAVGKAPIDVEAMQLDLVSLTAHKMYGPKGCGALYVRRKRPKLEIQSLIDGGGQERGLRSGTLNVPGMVGFGEACRICAEEMTAESARLLELRGRMERVILGELDDVHLNGHPTDRLPGTMNLSFGGVEAEALMMGIKEVAVSAGAACTSATLEPSYVLKALGVPRKLALRAIRFSLGRFNTAEEADYVARRVVEVVRRLRERPDVDEALRGSVDLTRSRWAAESDEPGAVQS